VQLWPRGVFLVGVIEERWRDSGQWMSPIGRVAWHGGGLSSRRLESAGLVCSGVVELGL
jgi:hypothetical protein